MAVTINDPDDWNTHEMLLNQGFGRLKETLLIHRGKKLQYLSVAGSEIQAVPIYAGCDFTFPAAKGERAVTILPGPGFVYAPVAEGGRAGEALVLISGTIVGRIPVYYGRTIEQTEEKKSFFDRIFGGRV